MNPIRTFISRPVFTGMLTLVLIVFGIVAYPRIGADQFPEVEFPIVTVTTLLPGADPETIERNVTKPLEEALNTLPGLDTLRSVNVENVSQVVIRFDLERKVDVAAQDVRDQSRPTALEAAPATSSKPLLAPGQLAPKPFEESRYQRSDKTFQVQICGYELQSGGFVSSPPWRL